jgi:inosose dehydratase
MSVRIGINPITWSNDDMPELGGATPLEVALSETKEAGYAGTEMGGKFPKVPATLRPILEEHGLVLVSGWYSGELLERSVGEEITAVQSHLDLLAAMGCKVMVYAETTGTVQNRRERPLSSRPRADAGQWGDYGKRLTQVAEHFLQHGVQMAFHHHMGTVVETEDEVDRLMENTGDAVGLLIDTGHATFAGIDPLTLVRRYGTRMNHVHCKDVRLDRLERAKKEDLSFMDAVVDGVFTVPGDGGIDFKALLTTLKEARYQGDWLVVEAEQDPAKAHPLTYAKKGYETLSRLAQEIGL